MANITNRRHSGDINISSNYTLQVDRPIDDRCVVRTQANLFDVNTWDIENDNGDIIRTCYAGMVVAVVGDSQDKNGVYLLINKNQFAKQSWDKEAANYNEKGWMKINGVTYSEGAQPVFMDKDTDNEDEYPGSFGGSGTEEDPYYVKTINGGEFEPAE